VDDAAVMTAKRFPDREEIQSVSSEAAQLNPGAEGTQVHRVAGRVMARRDMGKLTFLDLVDRTGRIQLLCPVERTGEVDVHLGDVVGAVGRAAKSRRGEPSLAVDRLEHASARRCRTRSTASPTSSSATGGATSTC
jgi:lysyl-tRNA synthetase class 2